MDKKEAGSPVKRGRPLKKQDPNEDPKKKANREAQNRYKQKVGKQINNVVNDLDDCDEERADLKDRVKKLTKLLADCETQVSGIMNSVKAVPRMGAKTGAKSRARTTPSAIQEQASSMIGSAIKQKLARKKLKETETEQTFKLLLR
jgi:cell division septum initiation protein DivIVA